MSLILAVLLAQIGPSVSAGPGGALPQAPLEIPKLKPPTPAAPTTRQAHCAGLAFSAPAQALEFAQSWLAGTKGSARADPTECAAMALASLERWSEAETAFLNARVLVSTSEPLRRIELLAGAAISAEGQGKLEQSVTLFKTAFEEAKVAGNPSLAGRLARDQAGPLYRLGRVEDAMTALAEARAALPEDALTWLISARASRKQKRLEEAQAQIEHAALFDPRNPEIGLEAGIIAVLSGRDEAARKSWQSVIAAAPDSAEAATAKSYLDQLGPEPAPEGR